MIFTERNITIRNDSATINAPVILYRGDKNVEVRFILIESPYKYSNRDSINIFESTDASYAQLVIKTPNDREPIFGDITAVGNNNVTFVIRHDMIDEIEEVGKYDFQIRLFDADQTSMATTPEVVGGFIIKEPIAKEDSNNNITNSAIVGSAVVTNDLEIPTFVSGSYNKKPWHDGDVISKQKLDKIEDGIYETYELSKDNSSQIKNKADKSDLDIERKRIDSFTSLAEGSTTGDAELIDIRIGANGKTYDSAGESVRTQFKDLNNSLVDKSFSIYSPSTANIMNGTINKDTGTLTDSSSNKLIYIKVNPGDTYLIDRKILDSYFFRIGAGESISIGSPIILFNDFRSLDKDINNVNPYKITIPSGKNYLLINYYNTNESKYTENDLVYSFDVYKYNILFQKIDKLENPEVLSKNIETYYISVKNNQPITYTDYPVEIKCKFPKGLVKTKECLKVFNENNEEIDFQICEVEDCNTLVNKNHSYYNDGSICAISIYVKDSFVENEIKKYIIKVYDNRVDKIITTPIITDTYVDENTNRFQVNASGTTAKFTNRGISSLNNTYVNNQTYIKEGSNYVQTSNMTLKNVIKTGNDTIFNDYKFIWEYNDIILTTIYRIYSNGIINVINKLITKTDIPKDTIGEWMCGLNLSDCSNVTASGSGYIMYTVECGSNTYNFIPEYIIGNEKRVASVNIPTYTPYKQGNLSSDGSLQFRVGWMNTTTVYEIPKEMVFNNSYFIMSNESGNVNRVFNKLIGVSANEIKGIVDQRIKEKAIILMKHLTKAYDKLYPNFDEYTSLYMDFIKYKYLNLIPLEKVISNFKTYYSTATSREAIYNEYKENNYIYNSEHLGKAFPIAMYIYNECKNQGLTAEVDYFKKFMIDVGGFYADQYNDFQDIRLHYNSTPNNNSRATGFYCLAQALQYTDDTSIKNAYTNMKNIIQSKMMFGGAILPDGDLVVARYLHYEVYAVASFLMGLNLCNDSVNIDCITYLLNYVTAFGQIKDEIFEASTERRGQGLTYAYMILCLLMKNDYSYTKMAEYVLEADLLNCNLDGTHTYPLDKYPNNLKGSNSSTIGIQEIMTLLNVVYFIDRI